MAGGRGDYSGPSGRASRIEDGLPGTCCFHGCASSARMLLVPTVGVAEAPWHRIRTVASRESAGHLWLKSRGGLFLGLSRESGLEGKGSWVRRWKDALANWWWCWSETQPRPGQTAPWWRGDEKHDGLVKREILTSVYRGEVWQLQRLMPAGSALPELWTGDGTCSGYGRLTRSSPGQI